ncbi:MAG: SDR family NAD(P)-dependent oxidoreductase [Chloroflexota bacterium]
MKLSDRVVLITGASSGIGYHTVRHLHQLGYTVYGTSRNPDQDSAGNGRAYPFFMVRMNVDDDFSITSAVKAIMRKESRLDIVVNSAGYGLAGAVEDTTIDEARQQFETNFFGVLRVCRVVLPIMRDQRSGYVINVGSIGACWEFRFRAYTTPPSSL